jgi:hypothetical protein
MEYLWREEDTELESKRLWNDTAEGYLLLHDKFFGTKFCICPHGFPVNTALIADSIRYECIPGNISSSSHGALLYNVVFFFFFLLYKLFNNSFPKSNSLL